MKYRIFDMHTHTDCSHDSRQSMEELCLAEIGAGMTGVAVTNHFDSPYSHENGDFDRLERSLRESRLAEERFAGQLEVLAGAEIGEELWNRDNARRLLEMGDWDVILASVHGQLEEGKCIYYAGVPFDTWSQQRLEVYLHRYLEDLTDAAVNADYDVFAHLDCPIRYINGMCHREMDILRYQDMVDEILRTVIRRDKTLEVNVSGLNSPWGHLMPEADVLTRYRELGGWRICLGSDAHTAENAGKNLDTAVERLIQMGFLKQTVYRKRCPVDVAF